MTHDEVLTLIQAEVRRALEALESNAKGFPYWIDAVTATREALYPPAPKPEIEVVPSKYAPNKFSVVRGREEYLAPNNSWECPRCGSDYADRDIAEAVAAVLRKREGTK